MLTTNFYTPVVSTLLESKVNTQSYLSHSLDVDLQAAIPSHPCLRWLLLPQNKTSTSSKSKVSYAIGRVICAAAAPISSILLLRCVARLPVEQNFDTLLLAWRRRYCPLHFMAIPTYCATRPPFRPWLSWFFDQL